LIDVAATFTSTCPAAGDGIETSSTRKTSGGPYRSYTTAFTSPHRGYASILSRLLKDDEGKSFIFGADFGTAFVDEI
jgi:hypothetical protein